MKDSHMEKKPKSFMEKYGGLIVGIPYFGLLILGITLCSPLYASQIWIRILGFVLVGFWILFTVYLLIKSTRMHQKEK